MTTQSVRANEQPAEVKNESVNSIAQGAVAELGNIGRRASSWLGNVKGSLEQHASKIKDSIAGSHQSRERDDFCQGTTQLLLRQVKLSTRSTRESIRATS